MNLTFASNQGDIGGGEVMLLAMAQAAQAGGHNVHIVAPESPSALLDAACQRGFTCTGIPGNSAAAYLRSLRRWDAARRGDSLLWCNGLRPSFATAGHKRRVMHLHQIPTGAAQRLAAKTASLGTLATVVPSHFVARHVKSARVLSNWTEKLPSRPDRSRPTTDSAPSEQRPAPHIVGYLGRLSVDKGVTTLCEAVHALRTRGRDVQLLVAGEHRFVSTAQVSAVDAALATLGAHVDQRGWMDRDAFFAEVDLAVFPSQWPEPFGLVAAEAMAARCPFVVSDAGGLPEVVGPAYPFTFPAADADALAETIAHVLAQDPHSEHEVLNTAYERWSAEFSPAAGSARFLALLDSLDERRTT